MNKTPPLSFLPPLPPLSSLPGGALFQNLLDSVQPPPWVVDEVQNRVVLLLNHIVQAEPAAQERIRRQRGKTARLVWGRFELGLRATPAGLLERPAPYTPDTAHAPADLTVTLTDTQIGSIVEALARGDKPAVGIEGDVQLASEVAWLVDNLRWDLEEDLARLMGDAPAHWLMGGLKAAALAVRSFGQRWQPGAQPPAQA